MLMTKIKEGDGLTVTLGDKVMQLTVLEARGGKAMLGVEAPKDVLVRRRGRQEEGRSPQEGDAQGGPVPIEGGP